MHKIKDIVIRFGCWIFVAVFGLGVAYYVTLGSVAVACKDDTTKSINDRITNCPISVAERVSLKVNEIAKIESVPKIRRPDGFDGYIEIIDTNKRDGGVEVFVRAWDKNDQQIGFGIDGTVDIERFVIINPPILIDDPNGTIIRELVDDSTGEIKTRKLREDLKEAVLQVVSHTIKVKKEKFGNENIIAGKIGNTTLTAYPNASTGTAPIDGTMYRENVGGEAYSTMRNGTGTGHQDTLAFRGSPYLKAYASGTSWADGAQAIYRGGIGFNTSSIDTDTVNSAVFSLYAKGVKIVTEWAAEDVVELTTFTPVDGGNFANGDYAIAKFGSTRLATGVDLADITIEAYNDWTLNASGLAAINKTGDTFFGNIFKWDFDNVDPPTWVNSDAYLQPYFADQTGTVNDPRLVVEHSVAAVEQDIYWFK